MKPLVSIILPTYKDAPYLKDTIESVRKQQYQNWELIVVDDGLSETQKRIVEEYKTLDSRIRSIKNPENMGIQKSLNAGIRKADGVYIARVDDDDIWNNESKLDQQITFLEVHPEYVLVGTQGIIRNEKGERLATYNVPQSDHAIRERILSKNCFIHSSVVMRKASLESVGGYNEEKRTRHIEDYHLWLRLGNLGKIENLPFQDVTLISHGASVTNTNRLMQAQRMYDVSREFRSTYPNFYTSRLVLGLRILVFMILDIIPIPQSWFYFMHALYKRY